MAALAGRGARAARAARALGERDLAELARASHADLARELGLGAGAARRLELAFELGRRASASRRSERPVLTAPARVFELLESDLRGLEQERFLVLVLDGKHRLRRQVLVSLGTLTTSLVHPREFFRPALREAAAAVIAVHNHPSGDPEPSREDIEVTQRLWEAGRLLGVPLLDHVVVGDGAFVSLQERLRFDAKCAPGGARAPARAQAGERG